MWRVVSSIANRMATTLGTTFAPGPRENSKFMHKSERLRTPVIGRRGMDPMEPDNEHEYMEIREELSSAPRLQPVPGLWLAPFDASQEARALQDYVERLKGDEELVQDLQWDGFAGQRWERFAEVLVAYGCQVLIAWILTGTVFAKCKAQGLRGLGEGPSPPIGRGDAEELAYASLGFAITSFRDKVLKPRVWTATGGATLKTYFVGQLLIQFIPQYKVWDRQRRQVEPVETVPDKPDLSILGQPELVAIAVDEAREILRATTTSARAPLVLTALGYSQAEIAEFLSLGSAKAVEAKLYRARKQLRGTA